MMQTWIIDPDQSLVAVRAQSTLHATESHGRGITGELRADLDALEGTAEGDVFVPIAEQSFGDRLRDFAMRRHLEVKRWPRARFSVTGLEVLSRDPWRVQVRGVLHYRDRETKLEIMAEGEVSKDRLGARARFELNLPEIGVKPPKMLFLKVADMVDVNVTIVAKGIA